MARIFAFFFLIASAIAFAEDASAQKYFAIQVTDEQTNRGVPLVELRTVNDVRYYTDSNGYVAFLEPGLMDQNVFFNVQSHGYEYPADGFGFHGKALQVKAGGSATLKIKRRNIAERLYRITGEGIYRDSVLLGKAVPTKQPLLNAQVLGQDSIQLAEYRGKLFWFWGDTNRASYPLGHFGTSGATSATIRNGLDPSKGVDLAYFTDKSGFSKPMVPGNEQGPKWIDGVVTCQDGAGKERLICCCSHMKNLSEVLDRSIMVFDDQTESFSKVTELNVEEERRPTGLSTFCKVNGVDYIYFTTPFPLLRVKANFESIKDPSQYEAFTCLQPGTRYSKHDPKIDRDADGKVVWGWKADAAPVDQKREKELLDEGKLRAQDAWYKIADADSGKPINAVFGSVNYNEYKKRWIMIFNQSYGTSMLGEIWYSEADSPEGPWLRARKIVTHDNYTFYNVAHHPQMDQENGRYIYFEGTYTITFSGNTHPTPRYEYNQIMYKLDLADPRLNL